MIDKNAKWWNNGEVNKRSVERPSPDFTEGRKPFKRRSPSEETRKKISESNKGKDSWCKGKTLSEETRKKMSESAKVRGMSHIDNTGKTPWNKGLTKETDERVYEYTQSQVGQIREGNYVTGDCHPNWNDKKTEFGDYSYLVRKLSERVYEENKHILNPDNLPRGRCGVEGMYQLDHIVSVKTGFDNGIEPEEIARLENLQLLTWEDNREKGK